MRVGAFWGPVLAVASPAAQAAVWLALKALWTAAYGAQPCLSEAAAARLSYLCIAAAGVVGLAFACAAIYLLVMRCRWWIALPLIAALCVPGLLAAAVHLYGLLVLLALA